MTRIEIGEYLAADSRVCDGRLIFKGSRILVADAISMAQRGYAAEEIARQYRNIISAEAVNEALTLVGQGMLREESLETKSAA